MKKQLSETRKVQCRWGAEFDIANGKHDEGHDRCREKVDVKAWQDPLCDKHHRMQMEGVLKDAQRVTVART